MASIVIRVLPPDNVNCIVFVDPSSDSTRFWFLKRHIMEWLFGGVSKRKKLKVCENHVTSWADVCNAVPGARYLLHAHKLVNSDVLVSEYGVCSVLMEARHIDFFVGILMPDLQRLSDSTRLNRFCIDKLQHANDKLLQQNLGLAKQLAEQHCKNKANQKAAVFCKRAEHNSWVLSGEKNKYEALAESYKEQLDNASKTIASQNDTIGRLLNEVGKMEAVCSCNARLLQMIENISASMTTPPALQYMNGEVADKQRRVYLVKRHLRVEGKGNMLVFIQRGKPHRANKHNNTILTRTLTYHSHNGETINFMHTLKTVLNKNNIKYKTQTPNQLLFPSEKDANDICVNYVIPICNIFNVK